MKEILATVATLIAILFGGPLAFVVWVKFMLWVMTL